MKVRIEIPIEDEGCVVCEVAQNGNDLQSALAILEQALRGAGFYFRGRVDIVDDEAT